MRVKIVKMDRLYLAKHKILQEEKVRLVFGRENIKEVKELCLRLTHL